MSRIVQSEKYGSDWASKEQKACNIVIKNQSATAFFGQNLPGTLGMSVPILAGIDPEFLTSNVPSEVENHQTKRLLMYLGFAAEVNRNQKAAINDFAVELLRMLGFEQRGCILRSRYNIPLNICGEPSQTVQTDICLLHHASTIFLLVQEDKSEIIAESMVIFGAIASFQENNRNRIRLGKRRKNSMSIPCITMVGTRPIFYVVPVTQQLCTAVEKGQRPEEATEVRKCVVGDAAQSADGMERLDFRLEALKHFVLFCSLTERLLSDIISDQ